jgi:hypothetical protein
MNFFAKNIEKNNLELFQITKIVLPLHYQNKTSRKQFKFLRYEKRKRYKNRAEPAQVIRRREPGT